MSGASVDIYINNRVVPVVSHDREINDEVLKEVVFSNNFVSWARQVSEEIAINRIIIQAIDFHGEKICFVKFIAQAVNENGKWIPGSVFMRGGSVGILVVLEERGYEFTVMVSQARVPTGQRNFLEIPAGMLDGSGDFVGKAAEEIKEELGIEIKSKDIVDITPGSANPGVHLSPGACDEWMRFYLYRKSYSEVSGNSYISAVMKLQNKHTGLAEEGERIVLKVMPLEGILEVPDGKSLIAYTLYRRWKDNEESQGLLKELFEDSDEIR